MQIPLDFWNVGLWLAVTAIILLITAQLVSAYDGPATLIIDKKRLKNATLIIGILFLAAVTIRVYEMIVSAEKQPRAGYCTEATPSKWLISERFGSYSSANPMPAVARCLTGVIGQFVNHF